MLTFVALSACMYEYVRHAPRVTTRLDYVWGGGVLCTAVQFDVWPQHWSLNMSDCSEIRVRSLYVVVENFLYYWAARRLAYCLTCLVGVRRRSIAVCSPQSRQWALTSLHGSPLLYWHWLQNGTGGTLVDSWNFIVSDPICNQLNYKVIL